MSKEKPQHIRAAIQVLEDLGPKQQAEFRKVLPVFAAKAAQLGEDVTEAFLQEHLAKGADHLQNFVKGLRQKPVVDETPLDQYRKIKKALSADTKGAHKNVTHSPGRADLDVYTRDINDILADIAETGDLDAVKRCVAEGADIRAVDDRAMYLAALNGHLDLVKYCDAEKGPVSRESDQLVLRVVAEAGHLDIIKYRFEETQFDTRRWLPVLLRIAVENDHADIVKYLLEKGGDLTGFDNAEEIQQRIRRYEDWVQEYGYCPKGLAGLSRRGFKPSVFADIVSMLALEGYKGQIAHRYAYHAAGLFGSTKRVLAYLEKWGDTRRQPLHNCIQNIKLPEEGCFNNSAWTDAVLKHGPKMARLVKFADRLPEPLKNEDGSWSYLKTREEIAKFAYPNGDLHPVLSALCMQYMWPEQDYNDALKHIKRYQEFYAANDNQKPGTYIPDIKIDGAAFDKPGYLFYKLPDGDLRGLFLGEMTNCCQHLAGKGAACTSYGFLSKYSGFYVIENKQTGEIVGQSWAWRGEDKALVLDSFESLGGHFKAAQWEKLAEKLAEKISENAGDITALHIGKNGATPELPFNQAAAPSQPKKFYKYRDSEVQYQVWRRPCVI